MSLRIQVNPNDGVTVDEVGGGGENPNYVETIEDFPVSLIPHERLDEFLDGIENGSLTLYIESIFAPRAYASVSSRLIFSSLVLNPTGGHVEESGINIQYDTGNGENLLSVYYADGWVNLPVNAIVTLTIIHHPLPES